MLNGGGRLVRMVEARWFQISIMAVIFLNAIVLGLQTSPSVDGMFGGWLERVDKWCIVVFVVELVLKMSAYRLRFFCSGWNWFDFVVVVLSVVPDMGIFSLARIFRVLRVFRLVSGMRHMRVILSAIMRSLPGVIWAGMLLLLVYYVYGIIGTNFFGTAFPAWFGSLGKSVYSLFQVMTLESWSMGIARPVMERFPHAWVFFVSYILLSSFIVMNIVVGIVLNSIGDSFKAEGGDDKPAEGDLSLELAKLRRQLEVVENALAASVECRTRKETKNKKEKS